MAAPAEEEVSLELVPAPAIEKRILVVRKRQVMLDEDLADLYGVETRRLIEQVKRNIERFPADFMFQLTKDEAAALRSQSATSDTGRGGRRYAPYVFTEQGVAMLSGVLRSKRAVAVNIEIMRAFVELRRAATSYAAIEHRLEELERETSAKLGQHDQQLAQIFQALRQLRGRNAKSASACPRRTSRYRYAGAVVLARRAKEARRSNGQTLACRRGVQPPCDLTSLAKIVGLPD
jgi:phage regulator Rha-like protein